MADEFAAIATLPDAFRAKHLNEEYRQLIRRAVGALARKRPSPLLTGKEPVWADAAVHAVGRVNFLDDPSQTPRCKPKAIHEFFGMGESTGQNKSKEIRDVLKTRPSSPEWTLPFTAKPAPIAPTRGAQRSEIDITGRALQPRSARAARRTTRAPRAHPRDAALCNRRPGRLTGVVRMAPAPLKPNPASRCAAPGARECGRCPESCRRPPPCRPP